MWHYKPTALGQGGSQFINTDLGNANRWELRWKGTATDEIEMVINQNPGSNQSDSSSFGLQDATFHHVAMIRAGDHIGLYIDGGQEGYIDATTLNGNSSAQLLEIFDGNGTSCIVNFDDIMITNTNFFSASPVSGKTDTITVPTANAGRTSQAMTLISENQEATSQPNTAQVMVIVDDKGNSLTPDTDIKMSASRDDGTTYTLAALDLEQDFGSNIKLYEAEIDISAQPADKTMRFKIETSATYEIDIVDAALMWA